MGLFWESSKKREERENKALEAILFQFEKTLSQPSPGLKPKEASLKPVKQPEIIPSSIKNPNLDTLIRFLSEKGIIKLSEWEEFLKGTPESRKNTNG